MFGWILLLIILVLAYIYLMPSKKPEVYCVSTSKGNYNTAFTAALSVAQTFDKNAVLATPDQLKEAQTAGAQWCSFGLLSDGKVGYPHQIDVPGWCKTGPNIGPSFGDGKFNVLVYGIKPSKEEASCSNASICVLPWYVPSKLDTKPEKWSQHDP